MTDKDFTELFAEQAAEHREKIADMCQRNLLEGRLVHISQGPVRHQDHVQSLTLESNELTLKAEGFESVISLEDNLTHLFEEENGTIIIVGTSPDNQNTQWQFIP